MKKILLLAITGILMTSGVSFATCFESAPYEEEVTYNTPIGVWVKLAVIFHRKKFDCQKGFGICVIVTAGVEGGGGPSAEGGCPVNMKIENNQLIMSVLESDLKVYEHGLTLPYFKDKTFITIEDYTEIPPEIVRQLGSSTPISIQPGKYPVTYGNKAYTVIFPI